MIKQTKILKSNTSYDLEDEVNRFILNKDIVDIKYSTYTESVRYCVNPDADSWNAVYDHKTVVTYQVIIIYQMTTEEYNQIREATKIELKDCRNCCRLEQYDGRDRQGYMCKSSWHQEFGRRTPHIDFEEIKKRHHYEDLDEVYLIANQCCAFDYLRPTWRAEPIKQYKYTMPAIPQEGGNDQEQTGQK